MEVIRDQVLKVLAEQINGNPDTADQLKPEQRFAEDLHCDSMDMVEIALALESKFNIEIDDDDLAKLTTVQMVINHVADLCGTPSADVSTTSCRTTHHHACDCREQQIAVLNKVALDAARLMDHAKNSDALTADERDECTSVRDRIYAACETLFPQGEDDIEHARRLIGSGQITTETAAGMTCCAEAAA
ncbi:MAG TPA: hypothetical protein DCK83_00555 [Gallionellaceae bacterium]|nr:hypothetical protein [Gallionellaceae bacterium]